MGNSASSLSRPSKISSGKDLLAKTKDVREMSNALFTFMYSVWEEREIWDIANRPGDYVIALSDMITQHFNVLGYTTKRNQIGEIYFIKYDKLKPPSDDGSKGIVQHRENAKLIAFFFIRIFQLLGAMLLVVKDISFPIVDPKTGVVTNIGKPETTFRPYTNQATAVISRFRPPTQSGGAAFISKDIALGPYEFLRYYLRQITDAEVSEYQTKYNVSLDKMKLYKITPNLFFEYSIGAPPNQVTADIPKQKFHLLITTTSKRPELKAQEVGTSNIFPSSLPGYLAPGSSGFTTGAEQLARYHITVTLDMKIGSKTPQSAKVSRTVTEAKQDKYENGVEYAFDSGTYVDLLIAQYDSQKDFKKILELLVLFAVKSSNNDKSIQLYKIQTDENTGTKQRDIGKMPSSISNPVINEFYQVLLNTKGTHQPHCISRALQLIDTSAIESYAPTSGKSKICKFAVGDEAGPINLATYKPLKSVAQLFGKVNPANFKESQAILDAFVGSSATTSAAISVKGLNDMGQKNEAADLSAALKRLSKAFEFVTTEPNDSFSQIQVSRPKECKTTDVMDINNQQITLQLQNTARQLLAYHINHTIEISKFLKTIFNIGTRPDGTWKVEGPKTEILFAGFPVLDQLTDQARDLLVDYYSGCEEVYQRGLRVWKESEGVKQEPQIQAPQANRPQANRPQANKPQANRPQANKPQNLQKK